MNPTILRFPPFTLGGLRMEYARGRQPGDVLRELALRVDARGNDGVWIYRPPLEELQKTLPTDRTLPLFGIPFAIKDNIDVAGWPTTAGCHEFAYMPERDATVVARLRAAGAIPVGKTNMDQFSTGLVGTRSPFEIPRCVFDERYLAGGSSSGSAVAVAAGLAAFALGTDTGGSGRVPAAFNGLVGLKPTRGLISTRGLVPGCRSLECVSIFAHQVAEAEEVFALAAGDDAEDPYGRLAPPSTGWPAPQLRFGLPRPDQLEFFGDRSAAALFAEAVRRMESFGHHSVEFDFAPFQEAAALLSSGPWLAERLAAVEPFFEQHGDSMDPMVRQIIASGATFSAVDAFRAQYELERLRKLAAHVWEVIDVLFLPTTGTIYQVNEIFDHPLELNRNLGRYTNFVNLFDLCALAVPAGVRPGRGLPFGVTLIAPAFSEKRLAGLGRQFLGEPAATAPATDRVALAVLGAQPGGPPWPSELSEREARLLRTCRTAGSYKLYALAGSSPPQPGLVRSPGSAARGVEVEIWSLSFDAFADFVANLPPPMVVGTVELEDGSSCKGLLCEPWALEGSEEITRFGSWRAYLSGDDSGGKLKRRGRVMKKPAG